MPVYDDDEAPNTLLRPNAASLACWLTAASSLAGAAFAAISTSDFIHHLDRQEHSIHCSFIPGGAPQLGESGCRAVMLSPYSSVLRQSLWGGLPISVLALAVFAYLVYRGIDFALRPSTSKNETTFLVAAHGLPLLMSLIMGYISMTKVGSLCKVCGGIYVVSALGFAFALWARHKAPDAEGVDDSTDNFTRKSPGLAAAMWFGEGVAYVVALVALYMALVPVSAKSAEGCGTLVKKDDPNGVLVSLGGKGVPSVAVLDPLCPACKAFEERLEASGLESSLDIRVLLFPLDKSCNWMLKESLHPGACAVSEAILCERAKAKEIFTWAFANQQSLIDDAKASEEKVRARIVEKFPGVKGCLGTAQTKNKLNKSLRYAVSNALPVLTPQLFVGDKRLCNEDTDLGLEYSLAQLIAASQGARK